MQDGKTLTEQNVWEHYKRVEAETFTSRNNSLIRTNRLNILNV